MKTLRKVANGLFAMACILSLTACSDDNEDDSDNAIMVNLNQYKIDYDNDGVWAECNNVEQGALVLGDVRFSHEAYESWGMVCWDGFCASRSTDVKEYPSSEWTMHQYTAITGGGVAGKGTPYIVGYWNTFGNLEYSNTITMDGGKEFRPESVYVTNTTWGYYGMKNGTSFNKKFEDGDWCLLHIQGVNGGGVIGQIDVALAEGTSILDTWKKVDLSSLGYVDGLIFTMSSSDSGDWGMNNPAYFCLDGFTYVPGK